jgi:hypothetical protein
MTSTSRRESRVEIRAVMAVGHVEALRPGDGVGRDGRGGGDRVLVGFLHGGVHDQEGIVREVDGDLALFVTVGRFVLVVAWGGRLGREDLADAELSCDAEGEASDDGARTQISQLVRMPAHMLFAA